MRFFQVSHLFTQIHWRHVNAGRVEFGNRGDCYLPLLTIKMLFIRKSRIHYARISGLRQT